jgi:hypothetical protein
MSLLALTASASIVVGMFATAVPAYSDDTPEVPAASCLVESEGEASVFVSSVVHAGESLSLEGRGWTAGTDQSRGFVVVTLDDGAVERGADMELPEWVPTGVARNRSAWAVLEVNSEGAFSGDIPVPSAWAAGESHQVAIGDGVSGTYVSVQVSVVDSAVGVQACSLSVNEPDPADPADPVAPPEPAPNVPGEPAFPNAPVAPAPEEVNASTQQDGPSVPAQPAADSASNAPASSSVPGAAPSPSSSAAPSRRAGSSGNGFGSNNSDDPTPEASTSTSPQVVSASEIRPKAHQDQQATQQAAREEEGRLSGWILAGGGLLALLGAVVTVSIVRKPHGGLQ